MVRKFAGPVLILILLVSCIVLFRDNGSLRQELSASEAEVIRLRKEAREENQVWRKLYSDCVEERNALVSKLKAASNLNPGSR